MPCHVALLVAADSGVVQEVVAERRRIRLNRKTPVHLAVSVIQSRPRVWKRLRHVGHSFISYAYCERRRYDQEDYVPVQNRTGVG